MKDKPKKVKVVIKINTELIVNANKKDFIKIFVQKT